MIIPSGRRVLLVAPAAAALGAIVALHYHRLGLTLSHYDARGHLVVARRIFDSLTPGWQQIGAVWLPLPHLLNAIPVQIDVFYRSGASAVALSIAAFAVATAAIAWIVWLITRSTWAAWAGAAVFALNPNVLYLQATPMTEPLLLALVTVAVAAVVDDLDRRVRGTRSLAGIDAAGSSEHGVRPRTIGLWFAAACMSRYEAWPVAAAAVALGTWGRWQTGDSTCRAFAWAGSVAIYPCAAIALFVIFSRVVIGEWFVMSGFFVPDNAALGHPIEALSQVGWGVRELSGPLLVGAASAGLIVLLIRAGRADTSLAAPALSLLAAASLPWFAFLQGHPFRIRYMVPLLAVQAVGAGVAAGLFRRVRPLPAIVILLVAALELRPLDASAPMVVEAELDRPNASGRRAVGDCLRSAYHGESIMASMGSLGHYMQDLSHDGFAVRDFLHEGNGDIWLAALERPRPYAGWILIEEEAEGGDMLARLARERPAFLTGFARACEGGGVALYRRE